jgi:hypothetical protein
MNPPVTSPSATPPSGDDAQLDTLLRESASRYIDDGGFAARVLGALPPPHRLAERRRWLLVGGATVLGAAITLIGAGPEWVDFGARVLGQLAHWSTRPVPGFGLEITFGTAAAALAVGAGAWWAWGRAR